MRRSSSTPSTSRMGTRTGGGASRSLAPLAAPGPACRFVMSASASRSADPGRPLIALPLDHN